MATKNISALVSEGKILTAPDGDEYLYIYEPDGADDANKGLAVKLATLGITGGWVEVSGWTYASATTITVPSGAASIYAVGDQIRLKQGGAYKYFYVVTVADTLLTVTGGSDYSVANAAITDAAFSKSGGVGHPGWFAYTPTVTYLGGTTDPTSLTTDFKFLINGRDLHINGYGQLTRGSGDREYTIITLPIATNRGGGVAVSITYATLVFRYTQIDSNNDQITLQHTAMNSDGYYWLTATIVI